MKYNSKYVSFAQLKDIYGIPHTDEELRRLEEEEHFPKRANLYLGHFAWVANEIEIWCANQNINRFRPIQLLSRKVDELPLTTRMRTAFLNEQITFIGQLVQLNEHDLIRIPNFGLLSLMNVKEMLGQRGLHLGMKFPEWSVP